MTHSAVIVRGTLKEDGTLELDEKPNLPPGPVRLIVEQMAPAVESRPGLLEVLDQIHAAQRARDFKGLTEEEMAARIAAMQQEGEEEEERWRQIWSQTRTPPPRKHP
jgi:hypothetical protein